MKEEIGRVLIVFGLVLSAESAQQLQTIKRSGHVDTRDDDVGRAGRVAEGTCYRLWTEQQHSALLAHRSPEILDADLAPLALDLALWGVADPAALNARFRAVTEDDEVPMILDEVLRADYLSNEPTEALLGGTLARLLKI